ncbi:MAG: helix-turn-helix domain-containing protein [bacterium]
MGTVAFQYKCQECGRGTVVEHVVPEYHAKIRGYPFTVKDAHIGICDVCGAEHFAVQETDRWERMFEQEHARFFLNRGELVELRKSLGLSMEQFAFLIGCTRQSLHNWERRDRSRPQSRMADLLLKLVRESHKEGSVDVIHFLAREAEQLGVRIELHQPVPGRGPSLLELLARSVSPDAFQTRVPALAQMAAETPEGGRQVVLFDPEDKPIGRLSYDFQTASLQVEFIESPGLYRFTVEIHFVDGAVERSGLVQLENLHAKLLGPTRRSEDEVSRLVLKPVSPAGVSG